MDEQTQEQQDKTIFGFFAGLYTMYKPPLFLYEFTRDNLIKAFGSRYLDLYKNEILYMAANKTLAEMRVFQSLLVKDGRRVTREQFVESARPIDNNFNDNWLRTEYNTTSEQAAMIRDWRDNEKPLLKYQTVNDANVRHDHAAIDGVIQPKDSNFWEEYYPPNGWNCRCYIKFLDAGKVTPSDEIKIKDIAEGTPDEFKNNPAISGKLWRSGDTYSKEITRKQKTVAKDIVNNDEQKV